MLTLGSIVSVYMLHEFGTVQFGLPRARWLGLVVLPTGSVYVRLRLEVLRVPLAGLGAAAPPLVATRIAAAAIKSAEAKMIPVRSRDDFTREVDVLIRLRSMIFSFQSSDELWIFEPFKRGWP